MTQMRRRPFIYVTWLKGYLIGDDLCRWSIWHRIHHNFEKAKSDFDSVHYNMEHTGFANEIRQRYIKEGFQVIPEVPIYVNGNVAELKGKVDLVAIGEHKNLIIEVKTGTPRPADKIQLMLYIWALPRTNGRFRGGTFDGLLVYRNYEVEISAIELDEIFMKNFTQFTKDIMSGEPDRKYPSPRECKWCKIANCDERDESKEEEISAGYKADFF